MIFVNKKILFIVILVIFFLTGANIFAADVKNSLNITMGAVDEGIAQKIEDGNNVPNVPIVIGRIIGGLLGLMGSIFFVMLVYGGFMWMTAQGKEQQIERARSIITWAVWGVVIILLAYVITGTIFGTIESEIFAR
jgi:hypothetical protein